MVNPGYMDMEPGPRFIMNPDKALNITHKRIWLDLNIKMDPDQAFSLIQVRNCSLIRIRIKFEFELGSVYGGLLTKNLEFSMVTQK